MGTLTISRELLTYLSQLQEQTELVDEDGNKVGVFIPKEQAESELVGIARQVFDLKEADNRLATENTYTTTEVLEHLKALEKSE